MDQLKEKTQPPWIKYYSDIVSYQQSSHKTLLCHSNSDKSGMLRIASSNNYYLDTSQLQ